MPVTELLRRWQSWELSELWVYRKMIRDREEAESSMPVEAIAKEKAAPRELTPEEILAVLDADMANA